MLSQPSLSAQVAKLERVLGVQIFIRGARGVLLSSAGEQLMALFRHALKVGTEIEIAALTMQDPHAIPLRIAVIPTVAPYLVPAFTRAMSGKMGPRIHWLELQTAVAEEAIATGKVDAILIADPPTDSGLLDRQFGWDPFMLILPRGYVAPPTIPSAWLKDKPLLLLDDGHCLREHTLSLCSLPEGMQTPFRATSLGTMVQMVAAGFGISVIPTMAVDVETGRADLEVRPLDEHEVGRTLRLAYSTSHPLARQMDDAADHLQLLMPEMSENSQLNHQD